MNKIEDFDKRINVLSNQESEAKGVYNTYVAKLKELGIKSTKDAEALVEQYNKDLEDLDNQITLLEEEIETKLEVMES